MTTGERIFLLRRNLNLNQEDFGKKINVTRSAISNYEKGTRNIMDRVISDICRVFNVNEKWISQGIGEMFSEEDTFSLDKYAKQQGCTDYELSILKSYFSIPAELRGAVLNHFKDNILPGISSSNDETSATIESKAHDYKQRELDAYALELDAEEKGEILSVLGNIKEA